MDIPVARSYSCETLFALGVKTIPLWFEKAVE